MAYQLARGHRAIAEFSLRETYGKGIVGRISRPGDQHSVEEMHSFFLISRTASHVDSIHRHLSRPANLLLLYSVTHIDIRGNFEQMIRSSFGKPCLYRTVCHHYQKVCH